MRILRSVAAVLLLASGCTDDSPPTFSGGSLAPEPIVDVIARVEPSVVTIRHDNGVGSGVIYRPDGVVVTNAHVVGERQQVRVVFADGSETDGRVAGTDEITDLAVVRVDRTGLPAVEVRSELPRVGETALAIGSPLGFENTVTQGIISGVARQIPVGVTGGRPLVDLIQTDAPISPGNSGGALIDTQGRLVGVNEAYIPPAAGAVSLGFAIPSSTVVDVADQLLATGTVAHPYLGVSLTTMTADTARALGVPTTAGALIRQVELDSPAARSGLRSGDIITKFNDTPVETVGDVYAALRKAEPGDTTAVEVGRGGETVRINVTLGTLGR